MNQEWVEHYALFTTDGMNVIAVGEIPPEARHVQEFADLNPVLRLGAVRPEPLTRWASRAAFLDYVKAQQDGALIGTVGPCYLASCNPNRSVASSDAWPPT